MNEAPPTPAGQCACGCGTALQPGMLALRAATGLFAQKCITPIWLTAADLARTRPDTGA